MIVIRSDHDLQTSYLYSYTFPIIDIAKTKYKVVIIENKDISENNLRKRIQARKPNSIFFNGHGSSDAFYDINNNVFIGTKSADVFNGTITFARACDSLRILGREAVKNGCLAFIGYKNKFFIARHHSRTCKPDKDPVAKSALECSNLVIIELLKGKNVKEAIEVSHNATSDKIVELVYSKEPWAGASLRALVYNDLSLGFEGNPEAKF